MVFDITQIVIALIGLCGLIITGVAVPWVKSRTTIQQQELISAIADTAVYAAQQLAQTDATKKDCAMQYVQNLLKKYNVSVDDETISTAIEAALKKIKIAIAVEGGNWS